MDSSAALDGRLVDMLRIFSSHRRGSSRWLALAGALLLVGPAAAQVRAIDPDAVIARDLGQPASQQPPPPAPLPGSAPEVASAPQSHSAPPVAEVAAPYSAPGFDLAPPPAEVAPALAAAPRAATTYHKDELVAASESVFGKGARDVAAAISGILQKQGEPNGYIVGTEGGGAFIFGLRYGGGTLYQKAREPRPVYWSGPSLGLDAGIAGGDTFVLVYNLDDPDTLFSRFGSGEGQAYVVGGLHVSYLRKDNVVLIPVRMGVGLRLGLNAGYMKFSRKQSILPF
jgi:hypothetical protein